MLVMNADFEAVVELSPIVWAANPRKRNNPRRQPFTTEGECRGKILRQNRSRKTSVATMNRQAISSSGEISCKPIFCTTNVLPQIKVVAKRAASARVFFVTVQGV